MPIGDLLASITGEKPKESGQPRLSNPPKRKADDNLQSPSVKAVRTIPATDGFSARTSRPTNSADLPSSAPAPRPPYQGTSDPSRRAGMNGSRISAGSRPGFSSAQKSQAPSATAGNGTRPSTGPRPTPSAANTSAAPKVAPKKGSFAEIMARAAKAQQTQGQVGKIQHKALEKPALARQRTDPKADTTKSAMSNGRDHGKPVGGGVSRGGASATARNGDRANARTRSPKSTAAPVRAPVAGGKKDAAQAADAKKIKKAAVATTGYQGTARPRPGAAKKPGSMSAAGGSSRDVNRHRPALSGGARDRRGRRDDYYDDEDMDDFIEYDDDEPEEVGYGRPRYGDYSEEDESDMEAGLSDIDEEEHRAEVLGRREDREQEALEQRLKREKEERKRRLMESASAKRR